MMIPMTHNPSLISGVPRSGGGGGNSSNNNNNNNTRYIIDCLAL